MGQGRPPHSLEPAGEGGLCIFPVPWSCSSCMVGSVPHRISPWHMVIEAYHCPLHGQPCSCGSTAVHSCLWASWHKTHPLPEEMVSALKPLSALFEPLHRASGWHSSGPASCSHARSASAATITALVGSKGCAVSSLTQARKPPWWELIVWPLQPALCRDLLAHFVLLPDLLGPQTISGSFNFFKDSVKF